MKIKTPVGYLIVTEQGTENSYPGVAIRFSYDGTEADAVAVAAVEYDTEEGKMKAYLYDGRCDEPMEVKELPHGDERMIRDVIRFFYEVDAQEFLESFCDDENLYLEDALSCPKGRYLLVKKILSYEDPNINEESRIKLISGIIGNDAAKVGDEYHLDALENKPYWRLVYLWNCLVIKKEPAKIIDREHVYCINGRRAKYSIIKQGEANGAMLSFFDMLSYFDELLEKRIASARVAASVPSQEVRMDLAKALTYIDMEPMDMGDCYGETVEFLCDEAGVEYDEDDLDENYFENKAVEAYEKLLKDGSIVCLIESMVEEIYDNFDRIRQLLVYHEWFSDVKEHPTVKAIMRINDYIQNIENIYACSAEHCSKMKAVTEKLLAMDLELCYVGHELGNSYFQYLDSKFYLCSNDSFTVGYILSDDDAERELGTYTVHAEMRSGFRKKGGEQGYTIAFNRKEGIVAHIYVFTKTYGPFNMTHKDTGCEMQIDIADLEGSAKQLAAKINELTVVDFG